MVDSQDHAGSVLEQFLDDVIIVVVLFGRAMADSSTCVTIDADLRSSRTSAVPTLFIQDNSPVVAPSDPELATRWDVHHRHDPANPGVSAAYRAGAACAIELGRRWLLFFDQDTEVPSGTLRAYAQAVAANPREVTFAPALWAGAQLVSPCAFRFLVGRGFTSPRAGVHSLDGTSLLNSGLCVARDAYLAIGGHDPQIPLDFSDHELVARLRERYPTFVLLPVAFRHGLSAHERQSTSRRLQRFGSYAVGARRTPRGAAGRIVARGVVIARGVLLAWRWRHLAFLAAGLRYGLRRG